MILDFKSIAENDNIIKKYNCIILTGEIVFINTISDMIKENLESKWGETSQEQKDMLRDFGIEEREEDESSNVIRDFKDFQRKAYTPSIGGIVFCREELQNIKGADLVWLKEYIRRGSKYSKLVVTSTEFSEYSKFIGDRALKMSMVTALVKLSFPSRSTLATMVIKMFKRVDVSIDRVASNEFIGAMSSNYAKYTEEIHRIRKINKGERINGKRMKEYLKGVNYYTLEDFMYRLIRSREKKSGHKIKKDKTKRVLGKLRENMSYREILMSIHRYSCNMVEFRVGINAGKIPVIEELSSEQIKSLTENERISKLSVGQFKRYTRIASQSTLKNWVEMSIESSVNNMTTEQESLRKILKIIRGGVQ